jgi:ubiquinone/menaquinone biosynthesis C-methylase UbiE
MGNSGQSGRRAVEGAVRERYASAVMNGDVGLCSATVGYDASLLDAIPQAILNIDYGCGDPTKHLNEGESVLDLGSGSGKHCMMAAQVVGSTGRVIGVDFNAPMLKLAREHQGEFAQRVGYDNVEFRKGRIQDLRLDLDLLDGWLKDHPVTNADDSLAMSAHCDELRANQPMVSDNSIDVIVSNCVLNLTRPEDRRSLFEEMYRVLKRGGRCVISDIVSDEAIPAHLREDPDLWSGCVTGAFQEHEFLKAFEDAGFYGMEVLERTESPWQTIEGIEFRSVTVQAWKGKDGPCLDRNQAVIYTGPWKSVVDDDGHTLYRGERMAVCDKTYRIYTSGPYADSILPVPPMTDVPLDEATPYDCRRNARRSARETKGEEYSLTDRPDDCCGPGTCC